MSHSNESSNSNYPIYDNYLLQTTNQQQKFDRRSPRGTLHNVLNSPELAEVHTFLPQNIKVGRSPNLFENSPNSTGSIDYTSLGPADNIVVYDDIGRNWLLNKTNDDQEIIIGKCHDSRTDHSLRESIDFNSNLDYNSSPKRRMEKTLDSNAAMESFDSNSKIRFATTSPVRKPGFPKVIYSFFWFLNCFHKILSTRQVV